MTIFQRAINPLSASKLLVNLVRAAGPPLCRPVGALGLGLFLLFGGAAFAQAPEKTVTSSVSTGIVVAPKLILTAHHAVEGQKKILVGRGRNEPFRVARLLAADKALDLALLEVSVAGRPAAIADWSMVPIGIEVYAIGFPRTGASSGHRRITSGLINGEQSLNGKPYWFQFSAEVHRGNSGGPVIAVDGSVIGMVTHKVDALRAAEKLEELPQNVNFGLKSSKMLEFLQANGVSVVRQPLNLRSVVRPHDVYRLFDDSVVMIVGSK